MTIARPIWLVGARFRKLNMTTRMGYPNEPLTVRYTAILAAILLVVYVPVAKLGQWLGWW
jgi:hypothetical protein